MTFLVWDCQRRFPRGETGGLKEEHELTRVAGSFSQLESVKATGAIWTL